MASPRIESPIEQHSDSEEGEDNTGSNNEFDSSRFDTIDEPVSETILRDLKSIGQKFVHVFYVKQKVALLQNWDLWGPLILCGAMALLLQGSNADNVNDGGPQFAEVFVIFWCGAGIVTINSQLLGGSLSLFQSLCVLGYCMFPLVLALIGCRIILMGPHTTAMFIARFSLVIVGFCWSTFASTAFLADAQLADRKALAIYPIFLFYFIMAWLVISYT